MSKDEVFEELIQTIERGAIDNTAYISNVELFVRRWREQYYKNTSLRYNFTRWMFRTFQVISKTKARKYNLYCYRNVHGDEVNYLNCRSIWKDNKGREYRVKELIRQEDYYLQQKIKR